MTDQVAVAPTRERLVAAMRDGLQRRGLNGLGVNDVLRDAGAPKGVLYHHFPGGKSELAVAAIDDTVERLARLLDDVFTQAPDPLAALETWIERAGEVLDGSGWALGCPLGSVSLESTPDDRAIRAALAAGFARLRGVVTDRLVEAGLGRTFSQDAAALVVAAYEGALLQARVAQDASVLRSVSRALVVSARAVLGAQAAS